MRERRCAVRESPARVHRRPPRARALKAAANDPSYDQYPQWKGIKAVNAAAVGIPVVPTGQVTRSAVTTALEAAFRGVLTPEQALNQVQEEQQALLDEWWAQNA